MSRILVVDDEEKYLHSIQRIFLDTTDYELQYADNGYEALRLAGEFAPDVILLDIMMPDMDGYEVCRQIKANAATAGIMVLFLSGKAGLDDRLKGYEVLADDYITKPFETEELLAKVRILLRLKKAQDELRQMNQTLEKIVAQRTRQLVLQERQAMAGRMVHGIVHNFRNPLMAAHGFASLVEQKMKHLLPCSLTWPPGQRQAIEAVNDDIKLVLASLLRIEGLVDSLLQKGRMEATDKYQRLNLNELLAAEVKFLEVDPEIKHEVSKEFQLDPQLPEFFGIYAEFSQLCGNMVKNAVDAMRHSPTKKITICTRHDAEKIYLDFKDTGQGISPEVIGQIFEPFFSTKPLKGDEKEGEATGTGLGLYACRQMMKAYHGVITVSSEPQVGTTFTVALPYTAAHGNERHSSPEEGGQEGLAS
ncbi:MAG: hybrid sensor histidine kinase/response regulator [Deltaproteobacteria bacterium]|nr:hybrid sensor histidine kinase/response regulator [Deltaproteobacteria bacterium]